MRLIFAGTPDFATIALEHLRELNEHTLVAVYTRPDKRKGRGRKDPGASAVKKYAVEHGLAVEQPAVWDAEAIEHLRAYQADLILVVAYGVLLPAEVLRTPTFGCVNIHLSLLPKWRGAAPVARAILNGDTETGVSLMSMDEGLDTGRIISQCHLPIDDTATSGDLYAPLMELGCELALNLLRLPQKQLEEQIAQARAQDNDAASYAHKLDKSEARIDWSQDATTVVRQIRAFNPVPGARACLGDEQLLLWEARAHDSEAFGAPGAIRVTDTGAHAHELHVQCGRGYVELLRLQSAGRRSLAVRDFLNGRPDWTRPNFLRDNPLYLK